MADHWGDDREVYECKGSFGERLWLYDETDLNGRFLLLKVYDGEHEEGEASMSLTPEWARQVAAELNRWADRG